MVKLLLEHGAEAGVVDEDGMTALHKVSRHFNCLRGEICLCYYYYRPLCSILVCGGPRKLDRAVRQVGLVAALEEGTCKADFWSGVGPRWGTVGLIQKIIGGVDRPDQY